MVSSLAGSGASFYHCRNSLQVNFVAGNLGLVSFFWSFALLLGAHFPPGQKIWSFWIVVSFF
jgi:hypothetical protein